MPSALLKHRHRHMEKYWFVFCKTDVLLEKTGDNYTIPLAEDPPVALQPWMHIMHITHMENGTEVRAVMVDQPVTDDPRYEMCGLRPSFYLLSVCFPRSSISRPANAGNCFTGTRTPGSAECAAHP